MNPVDHPHGGGEGVPEAWNCLYLALEKDKRKTKWKSDVWFLLQDLIKVGVIKGINAYVGVNEEENKMDEDGEPPPDGGDAGGGVTVGLCVGHRGASQHWIAGLRSASPSKGKRGRGAALPPAVESYRDLPDATKSPTCEVRDIQNFPGMRADNGGPGGGGGGGKTAALASASESSTVGAAWKLADDAGPPSNRVFLSMRALLDSSSAATQRSSPRTTHCTSSPRSS